MNKKIIAFVTLFYPTDNVIQNLLKLESQVDYIILLDNSPNNNNTMFNCLKKVKYIFNNKNLGLSSAFNKGLKSDNFEDEDYILFFDQDSSIPDLYVKQLVNYYEQAEEKVNIGCIGPQYLDTNEQKVIAPRNKGFVVDGCYLVSSMITSGLLTKYKVLKDIEFWNEEIFLDMADWDLCWRLKEKNYDIVLCSKITLIHTLGKGIKKILFLKIRDNHPVREYYQIRDCKKLFKKRYVPLKFKIRFLIMLYIMPIVYIIVLPNKKMRYKYIHDAFIDFYKKRNGSYNEFHN